MSKRKSTFRKRILVEGDRAGRMPLPRWKKWGWWFWPTTAVAIAAGTYWGTRHIEIHLEQAAPLIIENAGFDSKGLKFKARHRTMDVSGSLPVGVSAGQLEHLLTNYTGPDGESIRAAQVHATTLKVKRQHVVKPAELVPAVVTTEQEAVAIEKADFSVTADIQNDTIRLMGIVPSSSHAETLLGAARQNFSAANIDNLLIIADQPARVRDPAQHVQKMASVVSNLRSNVISAQLYLDNDRLSGDVYTKSREDQTALQATINDASVNVMLTDNGAQSNWALQSADENTVFLEPDSVATDNHVSLQTQISALELEISTKVVFAPASDVLENSAYAVLDKIADIILSMPRQIVQIAGHTDSHSDDTSNLLLSEKRAKAVVKYLVERGIEADDLLAVGYGESQPIYSNDTAEGRAKNRRVEFWVLPNRSAEFNY